MDNQISLRIDTTVDTSGAQTELERLLGLVKQLAFTTVHMISQTTQKVKTLVGIGDASKQAAKGQQALAKATAAAGKAAASSIASFDELNVVQSKSMAGGSAKPPVGEKDKPKEPFWVKLLADAMDKLRGVMELLKPLAQWFWEGFLLPLGNWTGEMVTTALEAVQHAFAAVSQWIEDNKSKLLNIWALVEPMIAAAPQLFAFMLDSMKDYFGAWCDAVVGGLVGFLDLFMGILTLDWEQAWSGVQQIFEANKELLLTGLGILWETLTSGFQLGLEAVQTIWTPIAQWFTETVLTPLYENFQWLWDGLRLGADICLNTIIGAWGLLSSWFTQKVAVPVSAAAGKMWGDLLQMFSFGVQDLTDQLMSYINGALELVETGANMFVSLINEIIDALNTISIEIPDWVPKYGGESFGIDIPHVPPVSIPRLATGAVIPPNAEFMAVLGDQKNGRNLEAPENLIRQIIQEETAGLRRQESGPVSVELLLDGDVIYRTVVEREQRQGYPIGGVFANAY